MLKTQTLLKVLLCFLLQYTSIELMAQSTKLSKFSFLAEVVPYATFYGAGADGLQIGVERKILKDKYAILLTYGLNKFTYDLSIGTQIFVNGQPTIKKYTLSSVFTPQSERIGGIPDKSLFQLLEGSGIKHYSAVNGAYIRNYGAIELLRRHYFRQKWELEWGGGLQLGVLSRDLVAGGHNETVENLQDPTGKPIETWIDYRISARYLYYGFTAKVSFMRKITDHFSIGVGTGLNQIMAKKGVDDSILYFSAMAKFAI